MDELGIPTKNGNIATSIYIETNCKAIALEGLTREIAETLVKIFWEKYHIKLEIKEPNDLIYAGKKIAGILTESKVQAEMVKYLVIGIGINTNQIHFREEIQEIATSIQKEFGIQIDNEKVQTELYQELEQNIERRIHS